MPSELSQNYGKSRSWDAQRELWARNELAPLLKAKPQEEIRLDAEHALDIQGYIPFEAKDGSYFRAIYRLRNGTEAQYGSSCGKTREESRSNAITDARSILLLNPSLEQHIDDYLL